MWESLASSVAPSLAACLSFSALRPADTPRLARGKRVCDVRWTSEECRRRSSSTSQASADSFTTPRIRAAPSKPAARRAWAGWAGHRTAAGPAAPRSRGGLRPGRWVSHPSEVRGPCSAQDQNQVGKEHVAASPGEVPGEGHATRRARAPTFWKLRRAPGADEIGHVTTSHVIPPPVCAWDSRKLWSLALAALRTPAWRRRCVRRPPIPKYLARAAPGRSWSRARDQLVHTNVARHGDAARTRSVC